jgi:hypothetical protein
MSHRRENTVWPMPKNKTDWMRNLRRKPNCPKRKTRQKRQKFEMNNIWISKRKYDYS